MSFLIGFASVALKSFRLLAIGYGIPSWAARMITLYDQFNILQSSRADAQEKVVIEAHTLGEAVAKAGKLYGLLIEPARHDDKYFSVFDLSEVDAFRRGLLRRLWERANPGAAPAGSEDHGNLDIHIIRGGVETCPKQDLSFPLLDGDVVLFSVLVC